MDKILCLLGPTGAGKTEAALALAQAFTGAVVNFDSRQVYRDIPITTAQPTPEEQTRCPHRLYGFLSLSETISAGVYAAQASSAIHETLAAGLVPILVGGTGLYLRALLEGLAPIPDIPPTLRATFFAAWDQLGAPVMHDKLRAIDPPYAAKVHPNDRQRVTRALEVYEATGRTLSEWHAAATTALGLSCLKLGIRPAKPALDRRLARRIESMLHAGALDEVRNALTICPDRRAPGLSGIGCAELAACLAGETDLAEAKRLWLANTKAYAKRQVTWFKKESGVHWFSPEEIPGMVKLAGDWLALGLCPRPGQGALPPGPPAGG